MKNKSTYSLLLNADSEEKGRSFFEAGVYGLVLLCMAVSGWHFVTGTVIVPGQNRAPQNQPASMIANAPVEQATPVVIAARG